MDYVFNSDTLLHGMGFNPMKLEGILRNGIVSNDYAKRIGIPFSKNYNFTISSEDLAKNNLSDSVNIELTERNSRNISLVRVIYITDDELSAYRKYIEHGISLIVEGVPYIKDKSKELIKRSDEVIVHDYIPKENIMGILVPSVYKDKKLNGVPMLPSNILNHDLIKSTVLNLISYLKSYNYKVDEEELAFLIDDLECAASSIHSLKKGSSDYEDAMSDYKEIISEISYLLSSFVYDCFSKLLKKEVTVLDLVEFINSKYDNKNIYFLNTTDKKVRSK